jgi:hypothetical protein
MKLLFENWRKYLLTEGMMTVDELISVGDNVFIRINEGRAPREVIISYVDASGKDLGWRSDGYTVDGPWGVVQITKDRNWAQSSQSDDGSCGEAWRIASSHASSGWGPLLYDVAMEYATMNGGGLTADRGSVSKDAYAVWNHYLNSRGDVSSNQLDDLDNTLTPKIDSDNCAQEVPKLHKSIPWPESPLSKKYTKAPDTINKLKDTNKLWKKQSMFKWPWGKK